MKAENPIGWVRARAFTIEWNLTSVISEMLAAGGVEQLSHTRSAALAAEPIREKVAEAVEAFDRLDLRDLVRWVFDDNCAFIKMKSGSDPCACLRLRHLEWSHHHDHVRVERMLFEGASIARIGMIQPDPCQPRNASYSRKMTLSVV